MKVVLIHSSFSHTEKKLYIIRCVVYSSRIEYGIFLKEGHICIIAGKKMERGKQINVYYQNS